MGSNGTSHLKRFGDTMTKNRDTLGSQHFPVNRSGSSVAGPRVRTDVDLLDQCAADLEPTEAVEHYPPGSTWSQASRSPTNAARASYPWVDFEHHAATLELRRRGHRRPARESIQRIVVTVCSFRESYTCDS